MSRIPTRGRLNSTNFVLDPIRRTNLDIDLHSYICASFSCQLFCTNPLDPSSNFSTRLSKCSYLATSDHEFPRTHCNFGIINEDRPCTIKGSTSATPRWLNDHLNADFLPLRPLFISPFPIHFAKFLFLLFLLCITVSSTSQGKSPNYTIMPCLLIPFSSILTYTDEWLKAYLEKIRVLVGFA